MKLLCSESTPDYARYYYPYVIWAVPEPGETPAHFFARGFLPASPRLDCFYLCRNLRVDLRRHRPSSENRRILRKGAGMAARLIPRAEFDYSEARRQAWKAYADARFGDDIMSFPRLDTLMRSPVINHLLCFTDEATGREVGTALLYLEEPAVAYYYYAFYELEYFPRSLGMYMMTWAVGFFAGRGVAHLHLGTCYSEQALYKTQFQGVEFFNGHRWSTDLRELKHLLRRYPGPPGSHLLQSADYLDEFHGGSLRSVADGGGFRCE